MAVRPEEVEAALVDTVCSRIGERVPPELADQTEAFVRRYYHWVPQEDLAGRSPGDLCAAASTQLQLLRSRAPGEAKVRVYNPEPQRDGWEAAGTVVEIVSDDMPFLVDSVSMELTRQKYGIQLLIHPVIGVRRDSHGELVEISEPRADGAVPESIIHGEIDRETDPERLEALERGLCAVLAQVAAAVEDWPAMLERLEEAAAELAAAPPGGAADEARAFLEWLGADKFVFLGYREYALPRAAGEDQLQAVEGSGLGILRHGGEALLSPSFARLPAATLIRARAREPEPLVLTTADSRSPVHRPLYLDYVGVKRFDPSGAVVGERRFLGLYTTTAATASAREVPVLRGKVDAVLRRAGFPPGSHDAKALLDILETYPRDELFQIGEDELFEAAMAILALGERQRVRLLVRHDAYERFVSCLVYVPRDRFNTANREGIETVLREAFAATSVDWTVRVSEAVLVRLHFIVRLGPDSPLDVDVHEVEERLVEVTRSWTDDLRDVLHSTHDDERADFLVERYLSAFPPAYRADYPARRAVDDIIRLELVAASGRIDMRVYQPPGSAPGSLRCKLYSPGEPVILSDILPIFELMGARVADERPYEVRPRDRPPVWIYDFRLIYPGEVEIDSVAFKDAFIGVWSGELENDRLGALVGQVGLTGREVSLLRAISKYLRQAGMTFSDRYLQEALTENAGIARQLVELFLIRFDPARHEADASERLRRDIGQAIDGVPSLDQDRILRNFLAAVCAVVRTNYFRPSRDYLSFKLDPSQLSFLPFPRPLFEVFVYSPRVEGIHLRGGRVARGGLRWSDRREDFRVEVLGLMKAQTVKNALIVPVGAKGGFVVKRPPAGGREALKEEAVACYETFIRGLLDVTDNIVGREVVAPDRVVRYDEDDPYLVVAADKGTASLSDLANRVAAEYGFWLGDAFASGGSHGYDHKGMGITARGAWESVKRHFRELGLDTQTTDFTVAGIGDMGGDVFGNGMLLSPHIRLVAAFNHEHVFLDPNPDSAASLAERRRLFEKASAGWRDYDPKLISSGGGVFSRAAKQVELSPEARAALGVDAPALTPNELIRAILRAPVDLLWNGGVGTFVKSSDESHSDAGDKGNDAVRVDASELRCRVVGEGGNLGLTQRARIEYALAGGRVNTDAIDNVAGVNTSDTEVNLKILLDSAVSAGELSVGERNELLGGLADAVAERVIGQSYGQALALSLERARAPEALDLHARLIGRLEQDGRLDRALEFLPAPDEIAERKLSGKGLTVPELAVLSAYSKNTLHAALLDSDVTEDEYLANELVESFPPALSRFREQMRAHRLRGDIIATQLANDIVDRAGLTFAFRIGEENDVPASDIARAYAAALVAFDVRALWAEVRELDNQIDVAVQYGMLFEARRLVARATRWLVNDSRRPIRIEPTVERIRPAAEMLSDRIPEILHGLARDAWRARLDELTAAGVPSRLATRGAAIGPLFAAFDVADIAERTGRSLDAAATAYFELASALQVHWLADRILDLPRPDLLQTLARAGLRDDLYRLRRDLTGDALAAGGVDRWLAQNAAAVESCVAMLDDIKLGGVYDVTTLSVALRALHKLIQPAA